MLHIDVTSVVYASGANMFKMSPELLDTWGRILNAVPGSTIMLYPYGPNWSSQYPKPMFVDYLLATFARHQISKNRIVILDPQPVPDRHGIREYLKVADIYLDSFPFSGTTSFIEPLETRLPIVTKQGTTFRGAMGAALIKAVGADELIAGDVGGYIEIAVALGKDTLFRTRMKERIKAGMENSPPFFDSVRYSIEIEKLFQKILARQQNRA
jgi:predicted O-linked N-acetylglucosamine transferase (SPINDLY family)